MAARSSELLLLSWYQWQGITLWWRRYRLLLNDVFNDDEVLVVFHDARVVALDKYNRWLFFFIARAWPFRWPRRAGEHTRARGVYAAAGCVSIREN